MDVATAEVRKGEGGWIFDEIQNLVEPIERRYMDVSAGPQRGRMPERSGRSHASNSPVPGAEELQLVMAVSADVRPGTSMLVASESARTARPDEEDSGHNHPDRGGTLKELSDSHQLAAIPKDLKQRA
jgi:hypothetical protein